MERLRFFFFSWLVLGLSFATQATEVVSQQEASQKSWTLTSSFEHYIGLSDQVDPSSVFMLDGIWRPTENGTLRVIQSFQKLYEVIPGQDEVQAQDTYVYYYYNFYKNKDLGVFAIRPGATIPVSAASRRLGVASKSSLRLSWTRRFWQDQLILSYRPLFSYQFNRYKQTPSGTPMKQWGLSHSLLAQLKAYSNLSIVGALAQGISRTEEGVNQAAATSSDGVFSIDLYAQLEFSSEWALRTGWTQAGSQIKAGAVDVEPFQEEETQYYMALDYTF
jgi:hypothetical protein